MPKSESADNDKIADKLDKISRTLDDILIIECARSGMTKAQTKNIVGGDTNNITRIWKHIKSKGAAEDANHSD